MAAKIRLHELARELNFSNKETLDLCVALGIGVKSHSSSIEDAQADRVRRKVEREGIVSKTGPEPEKPKKGAKKGADGQDAGEAAEVGEVRPEPVAPAVPGPAPMVPGPSAPEIGRAHV